ncbi:uncharacterized protein LOC132266356 [Cornus florida]|uniref:uncharacterized protein LOC132266356 n=1 Tax=Cornus florida TaxID=4283 RepID=UPI00289FD908|nr:uncharacterized protein LOC132266356 [Cornus florida]
MEEFKWDDVHQRAFDQIKQYLSSPPVMMPPRKKWLMKLYLSAAEESIGAINEIKSLYVACFGLHCSSNRSLKYMLSRPLITGRIGKWALALMEFNFSYVPQKAIKGRTLADFLADHPSPEIESQVFDELDLAAIFMTPWMLMFDGSSTNEGSGAGIVLISPTGNQISFSLFLDFRCSNNQAEYEVMIIGLEILLEMTVKDVHIVGDSSLTKAMNKIANDLAQTASGVRVPNGMKERIMKITRRSLPSAEARNQIMEEVFATDMAELDDDDWRIPYLLFLQYPTPEAD